MAGDQLLSRGTSREVLRMQALADLDAFIQTVAQARRDIRAYQTVLEKNRRNLAKGGRASDMAGLFDLASVVSSFTDRLNAIERVRGASRRSLWRLQLAEGMTIAEIARAWGFSRQLVSRALGATNDRRSR